MRNRQLSLIFFLIAELYLYVMLICFNSLINIKILSFLSILLCFIISLFMHCKTKDYYIMILALFFTLLSDIFFIFFDKLIVFGLISLNITQILYFLRIYIDSEYEKKNLINRVIFIPLGLIFCYLLLKERMDISSILWVIFIINLFINILFTIKEIGLNNFFPIGLLLLLMYSVSMMFVSLPNYININVPFIDFLIELPFDIKWAFYLPAVVVLTCSIFTVNRRSYSKINRDEE